MMSQRRICRPIGGVVVMGALLSGCISPTWVSGAGKQTSSQETANVTVDAPVGWMRLNADPSLVLGKKEHKYEPLLILVRDGITLQMVRVIRQRIDGELDFSKKKLTKEMLPQELADALFDDVRSDPDKGSQELLESAPALVGGQTGFRLAYRYTTMGGLRREAVHYGAIKEPWVYGLIYDAPRRHYFQKTLSDFEHMKESIMFAPGPATP